MSPHDHHVLFRFLTENTSEPRLMKSSNDRLFDILKRNLSTPKGKDQWSHLVGENRAVQVVTTREHVWVMSTAAVRLSDGMYGSWVTRANEMKGIAKHPAFRVRSSSKAYLS